MIKIDNKSNKLMISHISDIDGMGSVILSKLIDNMDILLLKIDEVRDALEDLLQNSLYQEIYMCDLPIPDDLADMIDGNLPIRHFDHHKSGLYVSKYSWSTVIPEIDGFKPCGTSLYYDYLKDNHLLNSQKIEEFVEAIRVNDTWSFDSTGNYLGKHLTMIFSMLGPLKFIDRFYNRLLDNNENFILNDFEKELIKIKENEMKDYIDLCNQNLIKTKLLGYRVGVCISENYRSEVGNKLSDKYKDELDFILIVDFMRKSFSTRTVNNIDLGDICKMLGGGGHPKAAGFPMNKENLDMILDLIKENM